MTTKPISEDEFADLMGRIERAAFRLELQPEYREPSEVDTIARFAAGNPQDPTEVPSLRIWYAQVKRYTETGTTIERVRVQDEPPTISQQWERWIGAWSAAAGEKLHYLTRKQAYDVGLLPAAGGTDWWLLDDRQLIRMWFDGQGHRIRTELTDDPDLVKQAQTWRDLAVRYGIPDQREDAEPAYP